MTYHASAEFVAIQSSGRSDGLLSSDKPLSISHSAPLSSRFEAWWVSNF